MALSDKAIRSLKPKEKQYKKFDGNGLYLLVKPNGSKLWQKKYNFAGKEKTISFGAYPTVSLKDAREQTVIVLKQLSQNKDPMLERRKSKIVNEVVASNTVNVIAQKWFKVKKEAISIDHAKDTWSRLDRHILSPLGNIPITDIDAKLVASVLETLDKEKKYVMIRRVLQILNEVMVYAKNLNIIEHNKLSDLKNNYPPAKSKNMPTISPKELPELMNLLYQTERITPLTRYLALFQLNTMVRPSESAKAQWKEINFSNKTWVIPAERMKIKKEHIVPLSKQVLQLLEELKCLTGNREFLFPSIRGGTVPHIHTETVNTVLKRNGFKGRLVAHGFRSIASTYLNEQGFNSDWIEACLAHTSKDKVRNAYNNALYLEQRFEVMQAWSDYIQKCSTSYTIRKKSQIKFDKIFL